MKRILLVLSLLALAGCPPKVNCRDACDPHNAEWQASGECSCEREAAPTTVVAHR